MGLPPAQLYTIEAGSLGPVEEAERYEAILTSLPKTVCGGAPRAAATTSALVLTVRCASGLAGGRLKGRAGGRSMAAGNVSNGAI